MIYSQPPRVPTMAPSIAAIGASTIAHPALAPTIPHIAIVARRPIVYIADFIDGIRRVLELRLSSSRTTPDISASAPSMPPIRPPSIDPGPPPTIPPMAAANSAHFTIIAGRAIARVAASSDGICGLAARFNAFFMSSRTSGGSDEKKSCSGVGELGPVDIFITFQTIQLLWLLVTLCRIFLRLSDILSYGQRTIYAIQHTFRIQLICPQCLRILQSH